jgi:hypothetical protein
MGGPPFGSTLPNWLGFAPAFNGNRVHAPVLMEYSPEEALYGLEMLAVLRRNGVPAEFVVYPKDGHVFVQPEHRYRSMERNIDWFRFWLQDQEDPDSSKQAQYARWREMRGQLSQLASRRVARLGVAGAPRSECEAGGAGCTRLGTEDSDGATTRQSKPVTGQPR